MRRAGPSSGDLAGMEAALRLARAAAVRDEVPVGAVIIHEGETLAEAHNETIHRKDPTAHAELLAIQHAVHHGHADRLLEATLYVTLEPCAQCAGAIVLARLRRVVFGAWDARAGMAGSVHDLLRDPHLNHRPEVLSGLMGEECGDLLKGFFRAKRD
ncbi:MAG: tRNA adenosine(34) deaminase TadA [Gemmatimonadales bacterium]